MKLHEDMIRFIAVKGKSFEEGVYNRCFGFCPLRKSRFDSISWRGVSIFPLNAIVIVMCGP